MRSLATALLVPVMLLLPVSGSAQSTVNIDVLLPLTGAAAYSG
jgi:hypothetical protein